MVEFRVNRRLRGAAGAFVALTAVVALSAPVTGAGAASGGGDGKLVVSVPKGLAKPNPGTGIGTQAALDHPRCTSGDGYGVYGAWSSSVKNSGPPCVVPLEPGDDNGGATSRGVTADSIKIVYVYPAGTEQYSGGATAVTDRTTGAPASMADAVYDNLVPMMQVYETWGRALDITMYESSGTDEAAQRADAVAIKEMKPFIVINGDTTGLKVLESELAKSNILVFGYGAANADVQAQAPYRWGEGDPNAALLNTAEFMEKQLAGKKAEFGGDAVQGETRKFGFVYQSAIPVDEFKKDLARRGLRLDFESTYEGGVAGALHAGDAALAQQQAPAIVSKMKGQGITTVLLAADIQMMAAMMNQATQQNWFPEWVYTGSGYVDFPGFLSQYPIEQAEHLFGLGLLGPYVTPETDPQTATLGAPGNLQDWYWGRNRGSTGAGVPTPLALWLMIGLHMAGPDLTPKSFERGLFSWPVQATGIALARAYGNQTGLPYPSRLLSSLDFAPVWVSRDTAMQVTGMEQSPSSWFVGDESDPVRYSGGKWPTKKMGFFDKSASYSHLTTRPSSLPPTVRAPCEGCPSTGGSTLTPGAPDEQHFVIEVPTRGSGSSGSS